MNARSLIALCAGLLFGIGLVISGMAFPQKVLAFLTLGRGWDPSLLLVMGGALAITLPGFWWMRRRKRTLLGDPYPPPATGSIDLRLVAGAALFGLGWGLAGYCPGPGLVGLALLQPAALAFVPAMLVGGLLARRWTG